MLCFVFVFNIILGLGLPTKTISPSFEEEEEEEDLGFVRSSGYFFLFVCPGNCKSLSQSFHLIYSGSQVSRRLCPQ